MRRILIAGNWKMFKNHADALQLSRDVDASRSDYPNVDIAIFPPFVYLSEILHARTTDMIVGAQNMHWEKEGAYTGEISPMMLSSLGIHHVLIGHSERRLFFGETDTSVNRKIASALESNLLPIVCVGERLEEREKGITMEIVGKQIKELYFGFSEEQARRICIAYEPVWAIGTGKNATPEEAEEVHAEIRDLTNRLYGSDFAGSVRILYGGSVKPENAEGLLEQADIDGALIGGTSLKAQDFLSVCKTAHVIKK